MQLLELENVLLFFAVGLFASTYGTLIGAGGGFIASPALLLLGISPPEASQNSLLLVLFSGISGYIAYGRRRLANVKLGLYTAVPAIPGALIGPTLHLFVEPETYMTVFAVFLYAVSLYLLIKGKTNTAKHDTFVRRRALVAPLLGFALGLIGSFFGIGGGLLMTSVLVVSGVEHHVAAATSLLLVVSTGTIGFLRYSYNFPIDPLTAVPLALGGILGGQLGPLLSSKLSGKRIKGLLTIGLAALATGLLI